MQSENNNIAAMYPKDYAEVPNLNYIDEYANRLIKDKLWAVAEYVAWAMKAIGAGWACGGVYSVIYNVRKLINIGISTDQFKPLQLIYYTIPHAKCAQSRDLLYYPIEAVNARFGAIRGAIYGVGGLLALTGLGVVVCYAASVAEQIINQHRKKHTQRRG
jgi:hypothetical protein